MTITPWLQLATIHNPVDMPEDMDVIGVRDHFRLGGGGGHNIFCPNFSSVARKVEYAFLNAKCILLHMGGGGGGGE